MSSLFADDALWRVSRERFEASLRLGEDTATRRFKDESVYVGSAPPASSRAPKAAAAAGASSDASRKAPQQQKQRAKEMAVFTFGSREEIEPQVLNEPLLVLTHHNGLRVVSLVSGHPIYELCRAGDGPDRGWRVVTVEFEPQLLNLDVKGKKKKGMVSCQVRQVLALVHLEKAASPGEAGGVVETRTYPLRIMSTGHIIEVNRQLVKNPEFLVTEPRQRGFIAIIGHTRTTQNFTTVQEMTVFMQKQLVHVLALSDYDPKLIQTPSFDCALPQASAETRRAEGDAEDEPSTKRQRVDSEG